MRSHLVVADAVLDLAEEMGITLARLRMEAAFP
jgi:hypothetical protein